jgi:predicted nucleic-acid-binding Zn-ribbon protein
MQKTAILGVFALFLTIFSNSLLADVEACKAELKYSDDYHSLFGLCNAYWRADDREARERILDNYNRKAIELGGPPMPGLSECPCWGSDELLDAACNYTLDDFNIEGTAYRAFFDINSIQFAAFGDFCGYLDIYSGTSRVLSTGPDEDLTCRAGIVALVEGDFLEECPYP